MHAGGRPDRATCRADPPQGADGDHRQEKAIRALRAALCGPNPQHVLIYGPPGVGKTAAARLILEEAKAREESPFRQKAKFVEIDATALQFDERNIADPLLGSVHDPIYQGGRGRSGRWASPSPDRGRRCSSRSIRLIRKRPCQIRWR